MLARRVWPDGRTRAYVCGRAATVADLRELGGATARVLRPARAPQADAVDGAARGARRLLRPAAAGAAGAAAEPRTTVPVSSSAAPRSSASWPALASASSICSAFELDEIEAADPSEQEAAELASRARAAATRRDAASAAATGAERDRARRRRRRRRAARRWRRASWSRRRPSIPGSRRWPSGSQALRYEAEDSAPSCERYAARARGR